MNINNLKKIARCLFEDGIMSVRYRWLVLTDRQLKCLVPTSLENTKAIQHSEEPKEMWEYCDVVEYPAYFNETPSTKKEDAPA